MESLGGQILQGLSVGGKGPALGQLEVEHPDVQPPLGADLAVQLPQGTGGGVPGIGEGGLLPLLPLLVELVKDHLGHEDLAPDDEPGQLLRQHHGDGADGAEVLRHVLPHPAVAPGGPLNKHAVPVLQSHAEAVHLGLHGVGGALHRLGHPLGELTYLLRGEHVLEALQRHRMRHLLKAVQGRASHPLGGGIRGDLLRVGRLQLLQPAELVVVVVVGHGGIVQHIVSVSRLIELLAQLGHLASVVHWCSSVVKENYLLVFYPLLMAYS